MDAAVLLGHEGGELKVGCGWAGSRVCSGPFSDLTCLASAGGFAATKALWLIDERRCGRGKSPVDNNNACECSGSP